MFTGIIEEIGTVRAITQNSTATGARLTIEAKQVLQDTQIGDSIAVNGCCLTVVHLTDFTWSADVVTESLSRTCLGDLVIGNPVNLEGAMRLNSRLGGHLVQGHIDGIGQITKKMTQPDNSTWVTITAPTSILRYVVHKGSITVDGVSLTVANVDEKTFSFAMIPHTEKSTNLGWKQIGSRVNLEVDLIAKYVEKLIS